MDFVKFKEALLVWPDDLSKVTRRLNNVYLNLSKVISIADIDLPNRQKVVTGYMMDDGSAYIVESIAPVEVDKITKARPDNRLNVLNRV